MSIQVRTAQRVIKCGECRQVGHNRRTCLALRNPPLVQDQVQTHTPIQTPIPDVIDRTQDENEDMCTICYEALDTNVNFVSTPCKHRFCFNCITKHLQYDNRCPMCRANLVETTRRQRVQSRPQMRVPQTPTQNNSLVIYVDEVDAQPRDYEEFLRDLAGISLEEARDIINGTVVN
jgi:hypothetical protein